MAMNASAVIMPVTTIVKDVPMLVKKAAELDVAMSAPARSMPREKTSLGDMGPVPAAFWPMISKLSMIAGIQKRPYKSNA